MTKWMGSNEHFYVNRLIVFNWKGSLKRVFNSYQLKLFYIYRYQADACIIASFSFRLHALIRAQGMKP